MRSPRCCSPALALSQLRAGAVSVPRTAFLVALGLTALWALAMAGIGSGDMVTWVAESRCATSAGSASCSRCCAATPARRDRAVTTIYGVVALVALAGIGLAVFQASVGRRPGRARSPRCACCCA